MSTCFLNRQQLLCLNTKCFLLLFFSQERRIFCKQAAPIDLLKTEVAFIVVLIKVSVLTTKFKILCSIVVLFERQDVKISRQLDYGHKNVASSFGRNDAFPDIFPRTSTQPFLCDCRCQKAGQQGSAVVRPLLSAKC